MNGHSIRMAIVTKRKAIAENSNNYPKLKKGLSFSMLALLAVITYMVLALYAIKPFNLIIIALAILFSALVLVYVFLFGKFVFSFYQFAMLLFCICQLLSFAVNGFHRISRTPFLLALFGMVLVEYYSQKCFPKRVYYWVFTVAAWLFEITFIAVEFKGVIHPVFSNRIGSLFGNVNDVARYFSLAFFLSLGGCFVSMKKSWIKILLVVPVVLSLYLILLTGSISNLLSCVGIAVVFFVWKTPKKYKWIPVIALIGFAAGLFLILQLPSFSYFAKRLAGMFNALGGGGQTDLSFANRFNVAIEGLELFAESPLFGYGSEAISLFSFHGTTHNNFTDILCYYGIFAFVAYEAIVLFPLLMSTKDAKKEEPGALLLGIYTFLFQLFLYSYNFKADMIVIPFTYCLLGTNISTSSLWRSLTKKSEALASLRRKSITTNIII